MTEAATEGVRKRPKKVSLNEKSKATLWKLEKLTYRDGCDLRAMASERISEMEDIQNFVRRVDAWYTKNEKKYLRYLALYGRDNLTQTEFKLALTDLQTPFSEMEIHLLYQMLDPEGTGMVDYVRFYEYIWRGLANKLITEDPFHTMDLEQPDKWVLMTFKIPSLEPFDMPTTFEHLIDLSYTGSMLRIIIQSRIPSLPSRNIVIFTDVSRYAETTVRSNQRLYEFNYEGGPKCAPEEGVIYYEFSSGRIDCSLIKNLTDRDLSQPNESDMNDRFSQSSHRLFIP